LPRIKHIMDHSMLQIKKEIHTLLKSYCDEHGFKMGSLVENLIKKQLGFTKPQESLLKTDKGKNR
jgi:hypothetical protein